MTTDTVPRNDPRWRAVVERDADADGQFVYGVRTTGVYCRPSCPSRQAKPENVAFFPDGEAARAAGFRPCQRCRPETGSGRYQQLVADLCRQIERADKAPTLAELAEGSGMSRYHLQRVFKAMTGLSPAAYARAHRSRRMSQALSEHASVTAAAYAAGYESSSHFYREASALGMNPKTFQQQGRDTTIRFALGQCSLGAILVAASERGICAITLGDDPQQLVEALQDQFRQADLVGGDEAFEHQVAEVVGLVEQPRLGVELPLDIRGTAFQQRVWQELQAIPPGETASYTDIARRIGSPRSVRAVAGACAANTLAVAIPCHRVVRSDGSLSGYRWGIERKRALLERERPGDTGKSLP